MSSLKEAREKTRADLASLRIHRDEDESQRGGRAIKWILLGTLLVIIGGAAIVGVRFLRAARLPEIETARAVVESGDHGIEVLTATGYVVAHRKAAVSPKISGRLEYLGVDTGSRVKAGQILARLEHHDIDAQLADAKGNLANLAAARNQASADLESVRASLQQAQANRQKSGLELSRQTKLQEQGVSSKSSYDTALAQARVDEAAVRSAEAQINSTQARVQSVSAQMASSEARIKLIEAQLEYMNIRSPFDGLVISKDAEVGETVAPAIFGGASTRGSVVTIVDPNTLEVEADINESSIEKIKMGLPADITLDALPNEKLPGETYLIVPTADRQKATVKVKVRFNTVDARVLPDMNAKVTFLQKPDTAAKNPPSRITVPKTAVQQREGKSVVLLLIGDRIQSQSVTVGSESGDRIEIKQGLAGGETVVLKPAEGLTDGARVRVKGAG